MKTLGIRNFLLFFILLSVALLVFTVMRSQYFKAATQPKKTVESSRIPDDVERVIEGYKFQEKNEDFQIEISGARIIYRGRAMLGLRSNVVKATFFEDVHGRFKTVRGTLVFSASAAEWSADVTQPFILKKGVTLSINGKPLGNVKRAKIFLKRRKLEIEGVNKKIIDL